MRERKGIDAHRRDANRERGWNRDKVVEIKIEHRDWLQCLTSEQSIRHFILGKIASLNLFHFTVPLAFKAD